MSDMKCFAKRSTTYVIMWFSSKNETLENHAREHQSIGDTSVHLMNTKTRCESKEYAYVGS